MTSKVVVPYYSKSLQQNLTGTSNLGIVKDDYVHTTITTVIVMLHTNTLISLSGRLPVLRTDDRQAYLAFLINVWMINTSFECDLNRKKNNHKLYVFYLKSTVCPCPPEKEWKAVFLTLGGLKGYSAGKLISILNAPWL